MFAIRSTFTQQSNSQKAEGSPFERQSEKAYCKHNASFRNLSKTEPHLKISRAKKLNMLHYSFCKEILKNKFYTGSKRLPVYWHKLERQK